MTRSITRRRRKRTRAVVDSRRLSLHIFSFRFAPENGHSRFGTVLVRGRMDQVNAMDEAHAVARGQGREPWLLDINSVPALRATPALDMLCRRHTSFRSFLELLTAPAGYRPSIRLDLLGRDGAALARAYDRTQAKWGDTRRAFVTGQTPRAARVGS